MRSDRGAILDLRQRRALQGTHAFPETTTLVQTGNFSPKHGDSVLVDPTSAPLTISLPPATGYIGQMIAVKNVGTSTNSITVDAYGAESIDGGANLVMNIARQSVGLLSDGSDWLVVWEYSGSLTSVLEKYTETLTAGSSSYTVNHALGIADVLVQIKESATGIFVTPDPVITVVDADNILVSFFAPTIIDMEVVVV